MKNCEGRYLYGIILSDHCQEFGPIGIGGRGDGVYILSNKTVAAIVSRSPIVKYPVSRETMLAHAHVLEVVAKDYTVLPVRFSTIAANEEIILEKVLNPRCQEFLDLAEAMEGKLELGIRVRWGDMETIFAELVKEHQHIQYLKDANIQEKNEQRKYAGQIRIGQLVQSALEEKRKREKKELLEAFKPLSIRWKEMQMYGDMNLLNAAFLVSREDEKSFDQMVNEIRQKDEKRKQIKYTISSVAYNFVELVVHW